MTVQLVDQAVRILTAAGIPAQRAWPGADIPHLTQAQAAVCLEKLDYAGRKAVVAVTVAVPMELGGGVCEDAALKAGEALTVMGGSWVQEPCKFTGYADTYSIRLLGTFSGPEVTAEWTSAAAFTVKLGTAVHPRAVAFRAEQKVDETTGDLIAGAVWTFRLEEVFRPGEGPLPAPTEPFELTVDRVGGTETYRECRLTAVQLENTATGLRQIRQGVAKSRSFIALI